MSRASLFIKPEEPDAVRQECGFAVALTLLPALGNPVAGVVEVTVGGGKIVLDSIDVTPATAFDVYQHVALYSEALRTFLNSRPAPLPEVDGSDEDNPFVTHPFV